MFIKKIPHHNIRFPTKLGCCECFHNPTLQKDEEFDDCCLKNHFCPSAIVSVVNPTRYNDNPTTIANFLLDAFDANARMYGNDVKTFHIHVMTQNWIEPDTVFSVSVNRLSSLTQNARYVKNAVNFIAHTQTAIDDMHELVDITSDDDDEDEDSSFFSMYCPDTIANAPVPIKSKWICVPLDAKLIIRPTRSYIPNVMMA
mmetsp:Transcript_29427/g.71009  ORF Transcript_29427/g.71009 Transcript_29427/m.71009 type:complete len:200 (-) Transcript_29427:154-753(-)